ncbi:MAG: UDP-N-acetylenolpyruvoylglucosamine reductase [Candidatus Campbellbacteria bacterium]
MTIFEKNSEWAISNGGTPNVALAPYTTFHIGGPADIFYEAKNTDELADIIAHHQDGRITIIGGGSNILVGDRGVRGVVIRICIPGIVYEDQDDAVRAIAGAGVDWDTFVADTIAHGAFGLENLSGIPGTVGASPIQNIGAYGAEVKDTIEWVETISLDTREIKIFPNTACAFGYRDSFFKTLEGKRYVVTRVAFRLSKTFVPNTAYKDIEAYFGGVVPSDADAVRTAVRSVRERKLPDPRTVGTAGSFFKNPILSAEQFASLEMKYPGIKGFPVGDGRVKVLLAWVLDTVLHLNGAAEGNVFCFPTQPLVLCARAGATAAEVDAFAKKIETRVHDATNIVIEREAQMLT